MIAEKTVFILGAGASCPYGFPSGARLRKLICLRAGFMQQFDNYLNLNKSGESKAEIQKFIDTFSKSHTKSIDMFMANNPKLASIGKYIIALQVLAAEQQSCFGEESDEMRECYNSQPFSEKSYKNLQILLRKGSFQGEDWYSYIYNQFIGELTGKKTLPNFSNVSFITFNYDRSLEYFFHESFCCSFTEIREEDIIKSLMQLKILHIYGGIASLKWQNPNDYIDYKSQHNESILQRAANNIKTIYEEKQNPELEEAKKLIAEANQIFFLGFGYASENMEILGLPRTISSNARIYGTSFGLEVNEINKIHRKFVSGITAKLDEKIRVAVSPGIEMQVKIENMDCLKLLRNYL